MDGKLKGKAAAAGGEWGRGGERDRERGDCTQRKMDVAIQVKRRRRNIDEEEEEEGGA